MTKPKILRRRLPVRVSGGCFNLIELRAILCCDCGPQRWMGLTNLSNGHSFFGKPRVVNELNLPDRGEAMLSGNISEIVELPDESPYAGRLSPFGASDDLKMPMTSCSCDIGFLPYRKRDGTTARDVTILFQNMICLRPRRHARKR